MSSSSRTSPCRAMLYRSRFRSAAAASPGGSRALLETWSSLRSSPFHKVGRARFVVPVATATGISACDTWTRATTRFLAHDAKNGWARVENVAVASNVTDVGEHRLAPGGTIRGVISFKRPSPVPDAIVATGPSTVSLTIPFESYSSFRSVRADRPLAGNLDHRRSQRGRCARNSQGGALRERKVTVEMTIGNDRRP